MTAKVHVLKSSCGMSDAEYRTLLQKEFGVTSSTALTDAQKVRLCSILQQRADELPPFAAMDNRPGKASGAQLRLISVLWGQVSRVPAGPDRMKALDAFCTKRFGGNLKSLSVNRVRDVVRAIEAMGAKYKGG